VELRLLGPVRADARSGPVDLGARRHRFVLAVLALQANQPVSLTRLIELCWAQDPPRTAEHAVMVCVSRLRAAFAAAGVPADEARVVRHGSGYLLRIDRDRVDAHRFQALLERARREADDARRVALLDEALGLWRGPALDGTAPAEVLDPLRRGLDEARRSAREDRGEAQLRRGRHWELLEELSGRVDAEPFRERVVGQYMLALYRCGRIEEALGAYRRFRERLAGELGVEPGRELRDLHQAVLRRDPGVAAPQAPPGPPPAPAGNRLVPAQLPPAVAGFVGRGAELAWLAALLPERPDPGAPILISAVTGGAGVGKTALAVQFAQQVRDRFPDGQLYVNLRGYGPGAPVPPATVLGHFLRALAVPGDQVPVDVDAATALYRSILAGRRVLVVLDNAGTAEQVRPLLPGTPGCAVVVTSRDRLSGLVAQDGARRMLVDPLGPAEAYALLADVLGEARVDAERAAAAELAELCARLPLALRIAAANLADQPGRRVAHYVAELRSGDLVGALAIDGDPQASVRPAFDLSVDALPAAERRLFRLVGCAPAVDVTPAAAAALAGCTADEARRALDRLATAHLLEPRGDGRYGVHDLLRRYAAGLDAGADADADRDAATRHLLAHYLAHADAAARLRYPQMQRLPAAAPPAGSPFSDAAAALSWLDAERANLVGAARHAASAGPRPMAWLLADALRGYLWLYHHIPEWLAVSEAARTAAEADDDLPGQALANLSLAQARRRSGGADEAVAHYLDAADLAKRADWTEGAAAALTSLADLYRNQGRLEEAVEVCLRACAEYAGTGMGNGRAAAHGNLGHIYLDLGRLPEADHHYRASLRICAELPSTTAGEAYVLAGLGTVCHLTGRGDEGRELHERGLAAARAGGDRQGEANALHVAAVAHLDAGRTDAAAELAAAAVALCHGRGWGQTEVHARTAQAGVDLRRGRPGEAARGYADAYRLAEELGHRFGAATALIGLAGARRAQGDAGGAAEAAHRGLALARRTGFAIRQADALAELAALARAAGDPDTAARYAAEVTELDRAAGYAPARPDVTP
jgi:DNA-binding SARP family transcriptional activator/tetratricopeptide (TPR) repeat protein